LLILAFGMANAKTLATTEKIDRVSEHFMEQLVAGNVSGAYNHLSAYLGVNFEQFNERTEKVSESLKRLKKSAGDPLSYALLEKQAVGEHFYKITYLLKYETAALIWELNYYQPDQGWRLVDVTFDANIDALFD